MKHTLYSIYWTVSEEYQPPLIAKNDNVARARLQNMLRDNAYLVPEEWSIWKLGQFDEETGQLFPREPEKVTPKLKENAE